MGKPRFKRRWLRRTIACFVTLLLIALIGPQLAAPIIRGRLQQMVARHLNAELAIGSLFYVPPFGVIVHNARLSSPGPDGQPATILEIPWLWIRLARLPTGGGPLVIQNLTLRHPIIHLIRTSSGLVGFVRPVKAAQEISSPETPQSQSPTDSAGAKLSDVLRLHRIALYAGEVHYQDLTQADAEPLVWTDIQIDANAAQTAAADYAFSVAVHNGSLADLKMKGTVNVDEPKLSIEAAHLSVACFGDEPPKQLPPSVQSVLHDYKIRGELNINGGGDVTTAGPSFKATVELTDASAYVQQWDTKLDQLALKLDCGWNRPTTAPASGIFAAHLLSFQARSGDIGLVFDPVAEFSVDAGAWRVTHLDGRFAMGRDCPDISVDSQPRVGSSGCNGIVQFTAGAGGARGFATLAGSDGWDADAFVELRDVSLKPRNFPEPIEHIAGIVRLVHRVISVEGMKGTYGRDIFFLSTARFPLGGIGHIVRAQEIAGSIDFHPPSELYPWPITRTLEQLAPGGHYDIAGRYSFDRGQPPGHRADYELRISADEASLSVKDQLLVADQRIDFTRIHGDTLLAPGKLTISDLRADVLGGNVAGSGVIGTRRPMEYDTNIQLQDIDMTSLSHLRETSGGQSQRLSGRAFANGHLWGSGRDGERTASDNFNAQGEFEIHDGDLWEIPILKGVADQTKVGNDKLTAGEAAGVFDIAQRNIHLSDAALSATAVGLQGSGDISFGGELDLRLVVAPLADWKQKLKDTGIPIISDVTGEVVGGIQRIIDAATSSLLYEFHVTGRASDPHISTIPTPVLTDAAALLFGRMISGQPGISLLDSLHRRSATRPASTEKSSTKPQGSEPTDR